LDSKLFKKILEKLFVKQPMAHATADMLDAAGAEIENTDRADAPIFII
jgi:hypothetical protein